MKEKTIEEMLKETGEMLVHMTVIIAKEPDIEGRDEALRAAQEMQKAHIEKTDCLNRFKELVERDYVATRMLYTIHKTVERLIDQGNEAT